MSNYIYYYLHNRSIKLRYAQLMQSEGFINNKIHITNTVCWFCRLLYIIDRTRHLMCDTVFFRRNAVTSHLVTRERYMYDI